MNKQLMDLRALMAKRGYAAHLVSSADAHQSEYAPEYWRGREWLSGFTGSYGFVAVTAEAAGLWTDGRYFIQAEAQLAGSGIELFKMGEEAVPTYQEWLAQHMPKESTLAFDGRTFSMTEFDELKDALKDINFEINGDLIGEIWHDRPAMPAEKAFLHEPRFTGLSAAEKLTLVRKDMADAGWYLTCALDSVAWLLNIRGRDIPQTPVVYAYALVGKETARVFIDKTKIDDELSRLLKNQGFEMHPYDDVFEFLKKIDEPIIYDPSQVNIKVAESIPSNFAVKKEKEDIITQLKAVKNETEIKNIRNAFIKDGVVWTRLLKYLNENTQPIHESDIGKLIDDYRQAQADYIEPSFNHIAAYMANAACMHYDPIGKGTEIKNEGFLLIDTGGQYLDGTTDLTRTVAMGKLTDEMKRDFTLVLKGHINLTETIFLSGTAGVQLDAIARLPLWSVGINYRSGTGHGLGYCLGVHEGPHGISPRPNPAKLMAGMLITNEPGVYKENRYGIRTENVLLVKEMFKNEDGTFLGFETLSFVPIDLRAADASLLNESEIKWINAYHCKVYDNLSPHLNEAEAAWLKEATKAMHP